VRVSVAYAAPGVESLLDVEVAPGAVVEDALRLSGILARHALDPAHLGYALHGRRATLATPLRDGDRVEILRPLVADPKTLRRSRAETHPLPRPPAKVKRRGRP
jgi:putative ubiquitin-RnfH superfamily antitoxin RatB of RatAB toxin-antitoxin module